MPSARTILLVCIGNIITRRTRWLTRYYWPKRCINRSYDFPQWFAQMSHSSRSSLSISIPFITTERMHMDSVCIWKSRYPFITILAEISLIGKRSFGTHPPQLISFFDTLECWKFCPTETSSREDTFNQRYHGKNPVSSIMRYIPDEARLLRRVLINSEILARKLSDCGFFDR